jgi:hypothetical protein
LEVVSFDRIIQQKVSSMLHRKVAAFGVVAALSLTGLGIAYPAGGLAKSTAATMSTYTNAKAGYSITYPKSWTVGKSSSTDLIAQSPDHNAFISTVSAKGTASAPAIKAQQTKVLTGLGKGVSKLTYVTKTINGTTFQISEQVVKTQAGKNLDVIVMDATKHGRLYDLGGGVVQGQKNVDKDNAAVLTALFSIKIK